VSGRLDALCALLDLEELDSDLYRGQNEPGHRGRLFGGQVLAQALAGAGRTVEGRPAHSLHAYFLRPGDPEVPVVYHVDRIRDGRSFTTRRVVARQRGRAILNMAASFHAAEPRGPDHQDPPPPGAPAPETLPTLVEMVRRHLDRLPAEMRGAERGPPAIDFRHSELPIWLGGSVTERPHWIWLRADGTLPDDPLLHQCVLTYATDMSLLDTVMRRHGRDGDFSRMMVASLDHALWFHRPVQADAWLLYHQESPAAAGARGFARGALYTRDGALVASVAQEGLVRPVGRSPAETRAPEV
jgi:acyl-CoA thioesterase-2